MHRIQSQRVFSQNLNGHANPADASSVVSAEDVAQVDQVGCAVQRNIVLHTQVEFNVWLIGAMLPCYHKLQSAEGHLMTWGSTACCSQELHAQQSSMAVLSVLCMLCCIVRLTSSRSCCLLIVTQALMTVCS